MDLDSIKYSLRVSPGITQGHCCPLIVALREGRRKPRISGFEPDKPQKGVRHENDHDFNEWVGEAKLRLPLFTTTCWMNSRVSSFSTTGEQAPQNSWPGRSGKRLIRQKALHNETFWSDAFHHRIGNESQEKGKHLTPLAKDMPDPSAKQDSSSAGLWQFISYFLKLGVTGFGGPVALVDFMNRDLVEDRGWAKEDTYQLASFPYHPIIVSPHHSSPHLPISESPYPPISLSPGSLFSGPLTSPISCTGF